jgi:hypothetical protein
VQGIDTHGLHFLISRT